MFWGMYQNSHSTKTAVKDQGHPERLYSNLEKRRKTSKQNLLYKQKTRKRIENLTKKQINKMR